MHRHFAIGIACAAAFALGTLFQNGMPNSGRVASAAMSMGTPKMVHVRDQFEEGLMQLAPGVKGKMLAGNSQADAAVVQISSVKAHRHNATSEFIYVLDGTARATVAERTMMIKPGDFVYLPNGVAHSIQSTGEPIKLLAFETPPMAPNDMHYVK